MEEAHDSNDVHDTHPVVQSIHRRARDELWDIALSFIQSCQHQKPSLPLRWFYSAFSVGATSPLRLYLFVVGRSSRIDSSFRRARLRWSRGCPSLGAAMVRASRTLGVQASRSTPGFVTIPGENSRPPLDVRPSRRIDRPENPPLGARHSAGRSFKSPPLRTRHRRRMNLMRSRPPP